MANESKIADSRRVGPGAWYDPATLKNHLSDVALQEYTEDWTWMIYIAQLDSKTDGSPPSTGPIISGGKYRWKILLNAYSVEDLKAFGVPAKKITTWRSLESKWSKAKLNMMRILVENDLVQEGGFAISGLDPSPTPMNPPPKITTGPVKNRAALLRTHRRLAAERAANGDTEAREAKLEESSDSAEGPELVALSISALATGKKRNGKNSSGIADDSKLVTRSGTFVTNLTFDNLTEYKNTITLIETQENVGCDRKIFHECTIAYIAAGEKAYSEKLREHGFPTGSFALDSFSPEDRRMD